MLKIFLQYASLTDTEKIEITFKVRIRVSNMLLNLQNRFKIKLNFYFEQAQVANKKFLFSLKSPIKVRANIIECRGDQHAARESVRQNQSLRFQGIKSRQLKLDVFSTRLNLHPFLHSLSSIWNT